MEGYSSSSKRAKDDANAENSLYFLPDDLIADVVPEGSEGNNTDYINVNIGASGNINEINTSTVTSGFELESASQYFRSNASQNQNAFMKHSSVDFVGVGPRASFSGFSDFSGFGDSSDLRATAESYVPRSMSVTESTLSPNQETFIRNDIENLNENINVDGWFGGDTLYNSSTGNITVSDTLTSRPLTDSDAPPGFNLLLNNSGHGSSMQPYKKQSTTGFDNSMSNRSNRTRLRTRKPPAHSGNGAGVLRKASGFGPKSTKKQTDFGKPNINEAVGHIRNSGRQNVAKHRQERTSSGQRKARTNSLNDSESVVAEIDNRNRRRHRKKLYSTPGSGTEAKFTKRQAEALNRESYQSKANTKLPDNGAKLSSRQIRKHPGPSKSNMKQSNNDIPEPRHRISNKQSFRTNSSYHGNPSDDSVPKKQIQSSEGSEENGNQDMEIEKDTSAGTTKAAENNDLKMKRRQDETIENSVKVDEILDEGAEKNETAENGLIFDENPDEIAKISETVNDVVIDKKNQELVEPIESTENEAVFEEKLNETKREKNYQNLSNVFTSLRRQQEESLGETTGEEVSLERDDRIHAAIRANHGLKVAVGEVGADEEEGLTKDNSCVTPKGVSANGHAPVNFTKISDGKDQNSNLRKEYKAEDIRKVSLPNQLPEIINTNNKASELIHVTRSRSTNEKTKISSKKNKAIKVTSKKLDKNKNTRIDGKSSNDNRKEAIVQQNQSTKQGKTTSFVNIGMGRISDFHVISWILSWLSSFKLSSIFVYVRLLFVYFMSFMRGCIMVLFNLHYRCVIAIMHDQLIGICYFATYVFPVVVSTSLFATNSWVPLVSWYLFLYQILCAGNDLGNRMFRFLLPLAFVIEIFSHRSLFLRLNGAELLLLTFFILLIRSQVGISSFVLLFFSFQIIIAQLYGGKLWVQWCLFLLQVHSLLLLEGVK